MTRRLFALALAAAALAGCGAEALSAADSQAAARIESYCGRIGRSAAQMGKAPSPEGQRLLDRWSDPEKLAARIVNNQTLEKIDVGGLTVGQVEDACRRGQKK